MEDETSPQRKIQKNIEDGSDSEKNIEQGVDPEKDVLQNMKELSNNGGYQKVLINQIFPSPPPHKSFGWSLNSRGLDTTGTNYLRL